MKPFHLHLVCIPLAALSYALIWHNLPGPCIAGRIQGADKVVVLGNESVSTTHPAELAILKGMFVGDEGFWMRCGGIGGQLDFYRGETRLESMQFQVLREDEGYLNLWYYEWGKMVLLHSYSQAATALVTQMSTGKCDCGSQHSNTFAAR